MLSADATYTSGQAYPIQRSMGALEGAARDAIDLGARLLSTDPTVQTRAEAEARALRARLAPASGGPTPEERFRARLAEALAKRSQTSQP